MNVTLCFFASVLQVRNTTAAITSRIISGYLLRPSMGCKMAIIVRCEIFYVDNYTEAAGLTGYG